MIGSKSKTDFDSIGDIMVSVKEDMGNDIQTTNRTDVTQTNGNQDSDDIRSGSGTSSDDSDDSDKPWGDVVWD